MNDNDVWAVLRVLKLVDAFLIPVEIEVVGSLSRWSLCHKKSQCEQRGQYRLLGTAVTATPSKIGLRSVPSGLR